MKPKNMTSAQYIELLEKKLEVYEKLQQRNEWKDLANTTIFAESQHCQEELYSSSREAKKKKCLYEDCQIIYFNYINNFISIPL